MIDRPASTDPRMAAAVASEYDTMRGLTVVPVGLGYVVAALLWSVDPIVACGVMVLAFIIGTPAVTAWYDKRYGRVRPGWRRNLVAAVLGLLAVASLLLALGVDHFEHPPVLISLVLTAGWLWGGSRLAARRIGLTWADHAVAFALLIGSTAPLWSLVPSVISPVPYYFFVAGAALVASGWLTHRRLVSLMGAPNGV